MKLYSLFLLVATATVLSPGPGVVMTLTNALNHGVQGTLGGILGIAFGAMIVALGSATSLGILLAASTLAFSILKWLGAAYLIYLGLRLWRSAPLPSIGFEDKKASLSKQFLEGLSLQLSNPKAIFFFLSVFPQFIDSEASYSIQFVTLVLTYSALVLVIHSLYALFARRAKPYLGSKRGGQVINKASGTTFVCFGIAMAMATK